MKHNPFIGMAVVGWLVFLLISVVVAFKPWAWMIWTPYLTALAAAPLVWWLKHRDPNPESGGFGMSNGRENESIKGSSPATHWMPLPNAPDKEMS